MSSLSTMHLGTVLVCTLIAGACAAPIDTSPQSSELDGEDAGSASGGASGAGHAMAGSVSVSGASNNAGTPGDAGGAMGFAGSAPQAGMGGTLGSAGSSSSAGSGTSVGGAGKGGMSSGGTSAGGTGAGGAGKAGAASGGSTSAAGASNGGSGAAGSPSTTPCDAAHSKATLTHNTLYTGKGTDCVRLSVNPDWAQVTVSFTPQPGTVYPVPFTYTSSCAASGNLTLTANYADAIIKSGANPGCDYFVQFKGGTNTVKVYYYD